MNRNQAQRILLLLIVFACIFVGNSIGFSIDQAATISINPDLWLNLERCGNCFDAMVPLAAALAKANQWTILGSLGGLVVGVLVAYTLRWYLRPRSTGPIRRLSGFRQASELARFSQALTDTTDPHRILTQLHTEVVHVTGADCGSSFLLDPTSPEHRVALRVGEGTELQRLNPMESEAVTSGRTRSIQDFEAEGEPPPHVGIRSALLVPITHEENAIGLIHLHSQQPATFDKEFIEYVQVLAAQAAVAIHNAQRFEEQARRSEALRQRVNQLQQLALIPNTVRVDRPLAANLESIAQTMQDTAGFGFVLISVYQPAGNHLVLTTATGLNAAVVERLQQQPVPWERLQPFLREEFRSNRVFLVPHAQTADVYAALDLDRPRAAGEHVAGQWHPDDLMLVPLYGSRGEIEGLISLSAPRDPQTPQNLVLEMLEVFASQTTLAIENAQALTQAEERLSESQGRAVQLGALTEVSGAIVGSLRVAEVIPLALDQLRRLIPYDSATFWKRDLTDNRWQLSGARSSQEDPERVAQRAERSQPTLFTEISATRGVLFVPDVTRDPRFSFKEASSMRSWMGVPVLSQGEVSGVLVLEKAEDNFYGAAHAPLALAFANRLAMALDNARLYEESVGHAQELEEEATRRALEAERRAQRLALLNRIALELADARDQAAVLTSALAVLREALGADYAAGLLFETDVPGAAPYIVAQARLPAGDGSPLPLTDNPLLERLAGAAAPLLVEIERAPLDAALLRPESLAWVGFNVGSAIFLPLEAEGRLAGLIGLGQAPSRRFWPADLDLAWAVAQQTVMALGNLRLRERTQEQTVTNQMVRALSRVGDRAELYSALREQLSGVAGLPQLSLALYDAERNLATFPLIVEGVAGATADNTPRPPIGLVRHTLTSRQPARLSGDLTAAAAAKGIELAAGQPPVREGGASAAAYLSVPLLLGEKVLGALTAHTADLGGFTDRQERLLAAAATQTAVALDQLQLFEQARLGLAASQSRTAELEALAETTVALSATLRVADLVTVALDQLQRLLPHARAVVWLRNPHVSAKARRNAAEWRAAAVRNFDASRLVDRLTLTAGSPLGDVLSTRHASLVADTGRDTRFGGAARAWLGLPLTTGEDVVGLIELENAAPGGFTPAHVALAEAFSTRASVALENARQYEASLERAQALDDQARRLGQLNQAALALGGNLDLDVQMAAAARLLSEHLTADQVQLILWSADGRVTDTTVLPAHAGKNATPAALAVAAPLWDRLRAGPAPLTLAELRSDAPGVPAEQLAWLGPHAATGLLLPLVSAGGTVGVAAIGWNAVEHTFTVAEVEAAQSLARLVAAALAEATQYETTQQRLSEQATANLISRAISQALDVPHIAEALRAQLDAWLKPAQLALGLYDPGRHEVSFPLVVRGAQATALPAQAPDPLLHHVITSQQPLLLTGDAPAQLRELGLPAEGLNGARAYLAVPLRLNEAVVGVLTVADPARAETLTDSHQRVLSAVALQLAISLDNAREHAELEHNQQRFSEQATAGLISRAISQALDVPHLADLLRTQLDAWLRPGQLWLALYDPARHEISFPLAIKDGQPQNLPAQAPSPLLHHLIASRQPILLAGESAAATLIDLGLPADSLGGARSYVGVPLRLNEAMLGVLAIADPARADTLTDSHQRILTTIALQVAITLENVRLYGEGIARVAALDERAQRLAWLNTFAGELAATLDVPQILTNALRLLADVLLVDQAGALLYDEAAGAPSTAQMFASLPPETAASLLAPMPLAGHPLFERIAENDRPLALDDLPAERLIRAEHTGWVGFELRSALFVPLVAGGRAVGLLGFGSRTPRLWSAADQDLAAAAAQSTALALANGRRYADVQARLAEQTLLSQVLRAVSVAGALDPLVEVLRARLAGWTGADNVYLALFDETRDELTLPLLVEHGRLRSVAPVAPGGLVRQVLQSRRTLRLSGDTDQLAHELSLPLHPERRRPLRWSAEVDEWLREANYLALPILLSEKALGVLAVEGDQPFTEAHERLLSVIAAQTAVVLDNSRLYAQTRQALADAQERVAQLEALTTALSNVASVLYSEDVVSVALEQFRRVLPYDHATFWQREATVGSGRELRWRLAGTRGYPEAEARQAFGLDTTYQALFGEIVAGRRPLLVADTSHDQRFGDGQPVSPRTWLGLPLVAGGEVVGLLVLEKLQPNAYAPAQVAPAMILANQVTAALTNARQFEEHATRAVELDERARRLAFLNRFGVELANNLDLPSLMRLTLKAMTEAMGLEQATGAVFDEQRTALLALEHYPEPAAGARAGRAALPGNFLLERLQEAPAPITLEDVGAPEAQPRLLRQADWIGQEVGAAMFVPLVNNGNLIGLVGLGQSEAGRHFTPGETELGMALANQAAAAVNQARLYERAQQRLAEQSSINQMSRALARAGDLRALIAELRQQLEAWVDAASIYLAVYDEDRNEVIFPLAIAHDQPVDVTPRAPSGLLRHILQRRQPLRLNGELTQQLKDQGLFTTGLAGSVGLDDIADFTSYLAAPLLNGERVTGAVLLGGPRRAEAFDESHERILMAVGAQLAAALEQARLFEQSREQAAASQTRAAQFSVLTDVTGVIATALRAEQVIALMLDQVGRVLPYDRAAYWQRQPAAPGITPKWRAVAVRGHTADLTARPAVELIDPHASPLAEVLASRAPAVVTDTAHDARFDQPGAWLGLPLTHKGEVLGLLALEQVQPGGLTAAQLPLAQAFGSQAAVVLANVSLYEDSLQRAVALDARTALLNRVSAALNSTLEPGELFHIALEALAQTLDLNRAAVIVFDESRAAGRLRPLITYPDTEVDQLGSLALTANPLLDHLRETLAPLAVEDVAKDALVTPELAGWIGPDVRSALLLPLVVAGKLTGLIGLGHSYNRRRFTPADLELGMTVANQAAIAAHNAGLYQRTHRRLVELASISQSSRALGQTIDLKQLYETVRTQVEVGLKADTLYLGLYDETQDELSFPLAVERGQAVELPSGAPDRLMRHILTTRQPLLLTGEIGLKLVELGLAAEGAPPPRAKAYLGVPLIAGAKVRGVLAVEDYKRAYAFTDKHEQSLLTIAAPIAAAVDGAALYEESAQKALALNARAALLGRVSAELSETTELDNLLRFTAQVISETLLTNLGAAIVLDESPETRTALKVARYPADDGGDSAPIGPSHPVVAQLQERLAPLLLDELEVDAPVADELRVWLGPEVASALFLPLITGDKLIGLVAIGETNGSRSFTSGELDLAMTLANQAAVAIANARLQQKVQPRLVELATITRLCRAIGQAVTLPQLSETLLTEIGATLKAETIYLALWDAPHNTLTFPLMFDGGQSLAARPQPAAGALRWILEQRQPLLLNGSLPRQLAARGLTYQPVLAGAAAPQSFLGVPLLIGSRVIGVLAVEDQNQVGKFGASQETILSTVAAPIAVAVENALLHAERTAQAREIEERATQLALVNRLSVALLGATAPETILALTLDTLRSTFGVAHAAALLATPGAADQWRVVRPTSQVASPDPLPAPAALLGLVANAGHALAVADLAAGNSPAAAELGWLAPAPRAVLLLPVHVSGQLVALLALAENAPHIFEPRAIDLAVTCVNQTAIALENSRLYQQAQAVETAVTAQAAQFNALAEVQHRITAAPDLDAVATTTFTELPRLVPFDSATLWLRDGAEPDQLHVVGAYGHQPLGQTLHLSAQPLYAEVIRAGTLNVPDTHTDPRFTADGQGRSWLGVALPNSGVLVLEKAEPNAYQPEHVSALQSVAGPLAARLGQTRQHAAALAHSGQVEAEARRLDLLQRVTGTIFRTLDLHSVLRGLLTELVTALPVDQAAALLFADPAAEGAAGPVLVQYPAQNASAPLPTPGGPVLARLGAEGLTAPVVLNHPADDGVPAAQLAWLGIEPAAALLLPLVAGDVRLGVIGLGTVTPRPFAPETVDLAQSLAQPAGAAVQNARAHEAVANDLVLQRQQAGEAAERYAQAAQTAQSLEAQLAAQTQTAQAFEQQLTERSAAYTTSVAEHNATLAAWRERYAALLAAHPHTARAALDTALNQALRVAAQAVSADYSVLYLDDGGRLTTRAAYGSADHLAAVNPTELAGEALGKNAPVIIGDLLTDPRWARPAAPAAENEGTNGAHDPSNGVEPATNEPAHSEPPTEPPALNTNGQYHSSLALPLGAGAGVLVFFSARPSAFADDALPTAQAAAGQIAFTLEGEARQRAWQTQAAQLRDGLETPVSAADATLVAPPVRPVVVPTTVEPVAVEPARPAHREPVVTQPVTPVAPALGEPEPIVRPAATPLWRRLALPVGALALVAVILAILAGGPLRGLFAGSPSATEVPATATVPAVVATVTQAAPATEAPASATVAPTQTAQPTVTATRTAEPSPTVSPEPSVTPTEPLPPDVLAVATVNLAEGIVGRLRDAPNGTVVGGLTNGTVVHVISPRQTTDDGITWVRIRLPDTGQTGYVGESLLQYTSAPPG